MALTATLIAFASGLAAKVELHDKKENDLSWLKPQPPAWVPRANPASAALRKLRLMQLDNEIERLDRALAVQTSLVEHWKGEARELARSNINLRIDLDAAHRQRDAALAANQMRAMARQQVMENAQMAMQSQHQLTQYNAQMAQQAFQEGYQQEQARQALNVPSPAVPSPLGLLSAAQNRQSPWWECTCIPDRARALRQG
jgi:hypothetical protein